MLRILLLGASGLVGREALRLALGRGDVEDVVIDVSLTSGQAEGRLPVITGRLKALAGRTR